MFTVTHYFTTGSQWVAVGKTGSSGTEHDSVTNTEA